MCLLGLCCFAFGHVAFQRCKCKQVLLQNHRLVGVGSEISGGCLVQVLLLALWSTRAGFPGLCPIRFWISSKWKLPVSLFWWNTYEQVKVPGNSLLFSHSTGTWNWTPQLVGSCSKTWGVKLNLARRSVETSGQRILWDDIKTGGTIVSTRLDEGRKSKEEVKKGA